MGQTGSGHFSPIGGYHATRDLALVLDVARFKYPPHWVPAERLWQAMRPLDPVTERARGWMVLRRRRQGLALAFSLRCDGESWQGLGQRLISVVRELELAADLASLARALVPLSAHLELRMPTSPAHREALSSTLVALRDVAAFPQVVDAIGKERAEAVMMLLLAIADLLSPTQRSLHAVLAGTRGAGPLEGELQNVRAQLAALWTHAR